MTVFRWIIAIIAGLLGSGALLAFVVFIASGIDLWIKRARDWRRLAWAASLLLLAPWPAQAQQDDSGAWWGRWAAGWTTRRSCFR